MGIPFGPKNNRKSIRMLGLPLIIILSLSLLWWQRNLLLDFNLLAGSNLLTLEPTSTSTPIPVAEVALAYSAIVTPENPAFTADFYQRNVEHPNAPPWDNLDDRTTVQTYTVQTGDTLWGIAALFNLELDTLRWSNPELEANPDLLSPNMELIILPINGAYHVVEEGDTLDSIALSYGVAAVDIVNYPPNNLQRTASIAPGDGLVIPNGRKEFYNPPPELDLDYPLAWPLVGPITLGYSPDEHPALDIGGIYGADIYAAADGIVLQAQWSQAGYGFSVVLDHGHNRQTLYSHLKEAVVQKGEKVTRGEVIGSVGSTGRSTGPHIHFEVIENSYRVNPLDRLNTE